MYHDIDFDAYVAELKAPWKTMGPDIDTALDIISKHSRSEIELAAIELISVTDNNDGTQIIFPDWQSEVERVFIHQYGLDSGKQIFKKVMMRLFQLSKGAAQSLN